MHLHWSAFDHARPFLRVPRRPAGAQVPPDFVEGLGHLHQAPFTALFEHGLLRVEPALTRRNFLRQKPVLLWVRVAMAGHSFFELLHPWRPSALSHVRRRQQPDIGRGTRHPWPRLGPPTPRALPGRALMSNGRTHRAQRSGHVLRAAHHKCNAQRTTCATRYIHLPLHHNPTRRMKMRSTCAMIDASIFLCLTSNPCSVKRSNQTALC